MQGILGAFHELDATVDAIEELQEGADRRHDGLHADAAPRDRARGASTGRARCAVHAHRRPVRRDVRLLDRDLDLATTGRWWSAARRSRRWMPYTILGFELMVLIGGLSTVVGVFIYAGIPRLTMTVGYDARFSDGDYGVWVAVRAREAEGCRSHPAKPGRRRCAVSARRVVTRSLRAASLALAARSARCSWFTDFKQQPTMDPWETSRRNDAIAVPRQPAGSRCRSRQRRRRASCVSRRRPAGHDRFDVGAAEPGRRRCALPARNGRKYFQINCAVCHGRAGDGDGGALPKYGCPPPSAADRRREEPQRRLHLGHDAQRSRPHADVQPHRRIGSLGRRELLRGLQGKIPAIAADTSPAARARPAPRSRRDAAGPDAAGAVSSAD